jgi:hypothetical protein
MISVRCYIKQQNVKTRELFIAVGLVILTYYTLDIVGVVESLLPHLNAEGGASKSQEAGARHPSANCSLHGDAGAPPQDKS